MRLLALLAVGLHDSSIQIAEGADGYPVRSFGMVQPPPPTSCHLLATCGGGRPLADDIDINRCRAVDKELHCPKTLHLSFREMDEFTLKTVKGGKRTLLYSIQKPSYPGPWAMEYIRLVGVSTPTKDHLSDVKLAFKEAPMNMDLTKDDFSKWKKLDCNMEDTTAHFTCHTDNHQLFNHSDLHIVTLNSKTGGPFEFPERDLPQEIQTSLVRFAPLHTIPTFNGNNANYTLTWGENCTGHRGHTGPSNGEVRDSAEEEEELTFAQCHRRYLSPEQAIDCLDNYRELDRTCRVNAEFNVTANFTSAPIDVADNNTIINMAVVALRTDSLMSIGSSKYMFNTSWPMKFIEMGFHIRNYRLPSDAVAAQHHVLGDGQVENGMVINEVTPNGQLASNQRLTHRPGQIIYLYIPSNLPPEATFQFNGRFSIEDPDPPKKKGDKKDDGDNLDGDQFNEEESLAYAHHP